MFRGVRTFGTASACDEAASVVTVLKAGRAAAGTKALRRSGDAMLRLMVLDNMVAMVPRRRERRRW